MCKTKNKNKKKKTKKKKRSKGEKPDKFCGFKLYTDAMYVMAIMLAHLSSEYIGLMHVIQLQTTVLS